MKFQTKNMKELYLRLIEEERKRLYMSYYINELKEMIEKLKDGSISSKVIHFNPRIWCMLIAAANCFALKDIFEAMITSRS